MNLHRILAVTACLAITAASTACLAAPGDGQLEIRAVDKATGDPVAARMHLKDAAGKPVRPPDVPFWRDHFVFDGKIVLELAPGRYTFEIEHGPEYKLVTGNFTIARGATDNKTVPLERYVEMKKEGWWSGELHIHRPPADIELHMRAEDLHIGPVITWWNNRNLWQDKPLPDKPLVQFDGNRFYRLLAGEDEREGGALLYFNLTKPLAISGSSREFPSPIKFLEEARGTSRPRDGTSSPVPTRGADPAGPSGTTYVHIDIEKPFWWDVPAWVATGKIDSIGLANNHQHRDGMMDAEAWGKPREKRRFASPDGNGLWSQHIYYQLLNCGLRIPPSAGSASGVLPNPVGYNRVYVHCGPELTWEKWWENLRKGQVVVTNGPMLRPRVFGPGAPREGALPGHVFQADAGQSIELNIALDLATRDKIRYLEIIQDGQTIEEVRLDQWAAAGGKLPPVKFAQSGWMLVRAIASHPNTFRFASTGPYYVEIGGQPRISKESAQFFLDWTIERSGRVKLDDPQQKADVLHHHEHARAYWQQKVSQANAD